MKPLLAYLPTIALLAALAAPGYAPAAERTWTSKTGSTLRGEIVGVEDGRVIIRPAVPTKAVPISSLSQRDQEFIEKWQKEEAERVAAAKKIALEQHMNTPLLKAIKGNLQQLDDSGKKLESYEIPTPEKLSLVAVYFTARTWDGRKVDNSGLKEMSKIYSRLRRRFPHFEMLLYPLDERETDIIEFMDEEDIAFPTLKHSEVTTENGMAVRATFAGTFPALLLMDREGKVLVNSREDDKPKSWRTVMDEVQEVVKDRAPDDDDEE